MRSKCHIIIIIRKVCFNLSGIIAVWQTPSSKDGYCFDPDFQVGEFLYFDPLDILDFIPPRLDLIILWFSIENELAGACEYHVHSSPVLSLFAVSTGQQETET